MHRITKPAIDWKGVGRRLRQLRGFEIAQAQFARELNISQGQLSKCEKGRSEIGAEILLRLSRRSGRTLEWLLTGKDGGNKRVASAHVLMTTEDSFWQMD
jgi:transcriptional regulator with XRE-family HTH domain